MPRRVLEVAEAIAWVEALERGDDPRMLVACDVRLWRPRDILSPQDGEWFEVMLPAEQVQRYLAKGFLADNPNPTTKPKPRARRKARVKVSAEDKRTDHARKT
jgi:hypothetical protein